MMLQEAIFQLNPSIKLIRGDVAYDEDGNEVAYDKAQAEALVQANQYKVNRAKEYPSYADQFDKIFHEGIDAWKAEIQAIKNKHPKVGE